MKAAGTLSLIAGTLLASNLLGGLTASSQASAQRGNTNNAPENKLWITAAPGKSLDLGSGERVITLKLPEKAQPDTLRAVLNGRDVSSRFHQTDCSGAVCEEAELSSSDGLRPGKNVLYAVAKNSDRTLASSRLRFVGDDMQQTIRPAHADGHVAAEDMPALPTLSNFLPPSVAFNTLSPGGFNNATPWIQIGSQLGYPTTNNCGSGYVVVIVDRQTLEEKTSSPESSPQCFSSGAAMAAYLKTLTAEDMVIAGTVLDHTADAGLDTSAVGGTDYTKNYGTPGSANFPQSYMVVGAGGAAPGSAFENYTTASTRAFNTFATGTLVEDANGNYNFQPSNAIEYVVSPNDPGYPGQSMIRIGLPPNNEDAIAGGTTAIYTSPTSSGGIGGYWLLVLQRDDLSNNQGCTSTGTLPIFVYARCGTFYATADSNATNATNAYQSLAAALSAVKPDQIAFLTTVGTAAASSDPFAVANTSYTDQHGNLQTAYAGHFAISLVNLGGTPDVTLYLGKSGSAYTLVSCTDCGNSLTGNAVLSTSLEPNQGQTGYMHGILQRSLKGLYWPTKSSQGSQAEEAAGGGPDYTIDLVGSLQPVDWPELSTLLSGATSIPGQISAYHYVSYQLITQYYIAGAQGSYLDDLHYYFAGSNNTFIDYHTFNPVNLPFPGTPGQCYVWTDPVTGNPLTCFTAGDFSAVAKQMSAEVIDLVNVLQYMVNGSTNMKDIVAAGNSSAALSLIAAATSVEASSLQPSPSAPVHLNVSNVLNLASSVVDTATAVLGLGALPKDVEEGVSKAGSLITGALAASSAATGGGLVNTGGGSTPLPGPGYTYLTTIADLANGNLQQQLTIGFDTQLDSILSDWAKLSQIGPKITDTSDPAFYSPNQVAQNAAVTLIGQGAQRSFYMSLLPLKYSVQFYPVWAGRSSITNRPDMGNMVHINECNTWYPINPVPANVAVSYPSYNNERSDSNWPWGENAVPYGGEFPDVIYLDWYLIAGNVNNRGKSNENIPVIDGQLASTLFATSGLNMPIDTFITNTGPMAGNFLDGSTNTFYGFHTQDICALLVNYPTVAGVNPNSTTTTLVAPASAVLGESVLLQATVTSGSSVPPGNVSFQDGDTVLGDVPLDVNGNASFSATGLSLGEHSITAYYVAQSPYFASQSDASALMVYANSPDMALSLSATTLAVTYGAPSSAVTLVVNSQSGMAGMVSFSCAGLPVGMTCSFNPSQTSLTAQSSVSTSFVIIGAPPQPSGLGWWRGVGMLLVPLGLFFLWRIRQGTRRLQQLLCLLLLAVASAGLLSSCSGSSKSQPLQESGSKTVLVSATCGSLTKSVPLVVNIQ